MKRSWGKRPGGSHCVAIRWMGTLADGVLTGASMRKFIGLCLLLWPLIGPPALAADADKPAITIFAAASLTNVLQELGDNFTRETSIPIRFSFAASSALARQIASGAEIGRAS